MKHNKIFISLLSLALIITSTASARYKSEPLRKMHQKIDIAAEESISFSCRTLNEKDCKKYFNSKKIIKKGYQPIQISFTNNSKNSIAISPESFDFRCAHALDVASSLHRDGVARGIGFGLGALVFTPLIIPALTQGLGATNYNNQMDIDFAKKAFKDQVVPPYTTVDGVIFASKDQFGRNFTLTVKDIHNKKSFTLSSSKPKLFI